MPGRSDLGERITGATAILVMGLGLLALFLGYGWWWMVFVLGWVVVTPLVAILLGDRGSDGAGWRPGEASERTATGADERAEPSKEDALQTLRDRYARGELSEAEFERKVERLLETETLEDARVHAGGNGDGTEERERSRASGSERRR